MKKIVLLISVFALIAAAALIFVRASGTGAELVLDVQASAGLREISDSNAYNNQHVEFAANSSVSTCSSVRSVEYDEGTYQATIDYDIDGYQAVGIVAATNRRQFYAGGNTPIIQNSASYKLPTNTTKQTQNVAVNSTIILKDKLIGGCDTVVTQPVDDRLKSLQFVDLTDLYQPLLKSRDNTEVLAIINSALDQYESQASAAGINANPVNARFTDGDPLIDGEFNTSLQAVGQQLLIFLERVPIEILADLDIQNYVFKEGAHSFQGRPASALASPSTKTVFVGVEDFPAFADVNTFIHELGHFYEDKYYPFDSQLQNGYLALNPQDFEYRGYDQDEQFKCERFWSREAVRYFYVGITQSYGCANVNEDLAEIFSTLFTVDDHAWGDVVIHEREDPVFANKLNYVRNHINQTYEGYDTGTEVAVKNISFNNPVNLYYDPANVHKDTWVARFGSTYIMTRDNRFDLDAQVITAGTDTSEAFFGDFNGDGQDTIAVRDGGRWLIGNGQAGQFTTTDFGPNDSIGVIGDWDGDGRDSVGYYHSGEFILSNNNDNPSADYRFSAPEVPERFGYVGSGDFNGDGRDGIAYTYHVNPQELFRGTHVALVNDVRSGVQDWFDPISRQSDFSFGDITGEGRDRLISIGPNTNKYVVARQPYETTSRDGQPSRDHQILRLDFPMPTPIESERSYFANWY